MVYLLKTTILNGFSSRPTWGFRFASAFSCSQRRLDRLRRAAAHGRAQVLKKNGGIKIPIEGLLTEVDLSDFCGYLTKLEVDVSDFSG